MLVFTADGHFWPEPYSAALYEVLKEASHQGELTEVQAIEIIKAGLFKNANRILIQHEM
ncbi:hypothetical protein M378DRAFT_170755 [Amanita muscaria Koide BX008]|uniref:Amidohydrolase n=1 Tax=Amanita muscaria (strain Koide BX008) TaxID=946122 RepID=A0A0C2WPZ4_AMAMK|nr:hypothetical protein M378DRAFT_170755 [Amanita muscaria Koide BX008]